MRQVELFRNVFRTDGTPLILSRIFLLKKQRNRQQPAQQFAAGQQQLTGRFPMLNFLGSFFYLSKNFQIHEIQWTRCVLKVSGLKLQKISKTLFGLSMIGQNYTLIGSERGVQCSFFCAAIPRTNLSQRKGKKAKKKKTPI